ncbi:hypothetical protein J2T13_005067 [Paenibacillus sp. DS2015]|uniref:hypothetical protein n=1 Tax=Paenibacillus sp. DS2015 TaxID=3373917 RepID=UPI003D1C4799
MGKLIIEPGKSIGDIKLGMSKEKVEEILEDCPIFYNVEYEDNLHVNFIETASSSKDVYNCLLQGIDPFSTKADELINTLDKISPYERNDESRLGFTYRFTKLGIAFWRSSVFKEEDANEDWFKEMTIENQEDELKHLYFESISVFQVND